MNQILELKEKKQKYNKHIDTELAEELKIEKPHKKEKTLCKKSFKIQFILSIISLVFFLLSFLFYQLYLKKQEKLSKKLVQNYSILRLYHSFPSSNSSLQSKVLSQEKSTTIGTIEIPKLGISYPLFSRLTDDFLKIAPCVFYGEMPPQKSNLCIAGHNYDNHQFFSKISTLQKNDSIILKDNYNQAFTYFVFDQYEVKENDLSPIESYDSSFAQLTLVTCNNFTKNRIIVKAKLENAN